MHDSSTAPAPLCALDPIWRTVREEVAAEIAREPVLMGFFQSMVLDHDRFEDALCFVLAQKLESRHLSAAQLCKVIDEAHAADAGIAGAARADLRAVRDRDAATRRLSDPLLYYKGFHALQAHRVAHWLWEQGREALASYLQNRISQVFGVDIHPAARIGEGIMIDHATSVVIGETAVVEDNVSILHEVTLGGTGKETGDRHPKVRAGVLIGAGAKLLGNVEIGTGAKIGAGSVVLDDVRPHCTVVGVPAIAVGCPDSDQPALEMDHTLPHPDRE